MTDVVVFIDALSPRELTGVLSAWHQGEMDAGVPRVTPRVMSSVYTGLDPAENGMLEVSQYGGERTTRPKKSTFIDRAVRNGRSVLTMGMPFCVPFQVDAEDVLKNGAGGDGDIQSLLNGDALQGARQTLPPGAENLVSVPAPQADMIKSHPDRVYASFRDQTVAYFNRFKEAIRYVDPDVSFLGYRLVDCYDEQTEVLTADGWKRFTDVGYDDKVATLDQDTHQLEYQHPTGKVSYYHEGEMYRLKTNQVDLKVTPNHRLYHGPSSYQGGDNVSPAKCELSTAEELYGSGFRLKKNAEWTGVTPVEFALPTSSEYHTDLNPVPMEAWLRFLGIWVGDGSLSGRDTYGVFIGQSEAERPEQHAEICRVLDTLGVEYNVSEQQISFRSKQVYEFLEEYWKPKRIPDFVTELSPELVRTFIEGAVLADGWTQGTTEYYATTSSLLADRMQELALKAGYTANIAVDRDRGGAEIRGQTIEDAKPLYRLSFQTERDEPHIRTETRNAASNTEEWVDYDGMVYCLEVPNHLMYVRRNGKPVWAGNSYCHFQHTETRRGKPYRQHLIEEVAEQLAELDAQVDGEVMFFSDHGQTEVTDVFRVNRWLAESGWLDYKIDYDFVGTFEEWQRGEQHPVEERVEHQVTFGQPGVTLNEADSQVVCDDPFDSCLTLLVDREAFDEERFREDLLSTGMYRSVNYKWELYDEDADFYEEVPDVIPDRAEGVFVSGNLHREPIGMGYYRSGVHDRTACFGATCELSVPDGTVTPEDMYDIIASFIDLGDPAAPFDSGDVQQFTAAELERQREIIDQHLDT